MDIKDVKKILEKFPKAHLGTFPTALQRMRHMEKLIGVKNCQLFIKRDDLTGLGSGGNKVRNLEYLLGDAQRKNCDLILASGKTQSNLCTLTVSACKKLGIDCTILHNEDEPSRLSGNQTLNKISKADLVYLGEMPDSLREKMVSDYADKQKRSGRKPYIIYNGATSAVGAIGYVEGVIEIAEQCQRAGIALDHLFVPGGNGGLAAGVIFGAAAMGSPFKIHVVTVEHTKEDLYKILIDLLKEISCLTGILSDFDFSESFIIHAEYRGNGWGYSTPESENMIYALAQTEGIYVEKIYTSKTVLGMLDIVKKQKISGNVCYLHSGGFGALFSQF